MGVASHNDPLLGETTCGSLLQQLQLIWDEVGESDDDRDKMLLQLEQECLDVYRRKVDQASSSRACLLQQLANSKSELTRLLSSLGELSISGVIVEQKKINDQLAAEQEKLFGSKPSPARPQSAKKLPGPRANGGAVNGTPNRRLSVQQQNGVRSASRDGRRESVRPSAPVNYVVIAKDDAASQASST